MKIFNAISFFFVFLSFEAFAMRRESKSLSLMPIRMHRANFRDALAELQKPRKLKPITTLPRKVVNSFAQEYIDLRQTVDILPSIAEDHPFSCDEFYWATPIMQISPTASVSTIQPIQVNFKINSKKKPKQSVKKVSLPLTCDARKGAFDLEQDHKPMSYWAKLLAWCH